MNKPLKLIKIGNSTGVILPKEVLARLRVGQRLRRDAILARTGVHRLQTLLDLTETLRIDIEALLVVAQHIDSLLRLRLRAGVGEFRTLRGHDQSSALTHLALSYAFGSLTR